RCGLGPGVRHGRPAAQPQAVRGPDGALRWEMEARQPEAAYPELGWELTVDPTEYVVIGTCPGKEDTLGQRCFLADEPGPRSQRLLVLRCANATGPALDGELLEAPPLALQAGWSASGGTCGR